MIKDFSVFHVSPGSHGGWIQHLGALHNGKGIPRGALDNQRHDKGCSWAPQHLKIWWDGSGLRPLQRVGLCEAGGDAQSLLLWHKLGSTDRRGAAAALEIGTSFSREVKMYLLYSHQLNTIQLRCKASFFHMLIILGAYGSMWFL